MFKRFRTLPKPVALFNLFWASAVYVLLLIIPPPPFISQALDQSGWLVLLLLFSLFVLLLWQRGNSWQRIQSIFIFALFALALIFKWQSAKFDDFIIGGLQPWSDASGYLQEAQRLLHGSLLTSFGARRPLFPAFLAVSLYLTGGNFMITLAVLTWVNALAVWLVVKAVRRSYGAVGASILLIFAYEFYMRFAGTTMTEQLGFALGNLAVYFLLIAAQNKNLRYAFPGLGSLSLALIARAGAFFILPVLIVWVAITFRSRRTTWRAPGLAIAIIASAFLLNSLLLRAIAEPQGTPFSNYSYTLYGLASGNKGWTQVRNDYPNAPESEVMSLAVQKIRSDPTLFLRGILGSYRDYFTPDRGAFTFISFGPLQIRANILLWGLILVGLIYATLNWKKGNHALVLASFLGVLASVALVPPIDANDMRAFAATIPFTALWIVEGGYALTSWGKKLLKQREDSGIEESGLHVQGLAILFSALLVLLAIPAPILLRALAHPSNGSAVPPVDTACGPGQQLLQGYMLRNTSVNLISNEAAGESYMPFIRIGDFQNAITKKNPRAYPFLDNELLGLDAGQEMSLGFDLDVGNEWMVSNFPVKAGMFTVCGRASDNEELRNYSYYFYYLGRMSAGPSSLTISQQYPGITQLFCLLYGVGTCIVIFLLVVTRLGFERISPTTYLYATGIIILILQGILVALYAQAIIHLPFAEQRITLPVKDAKRDRGLYILPLGINWMSQDDLGLSPAIVYENGVPLAMPNSKPKPIRSDGNGRYSVAGGTLYFSSSDNTDPRTNGRKYELEWPHPIHPALQWLSYIVTLFGVILLIFGQRKMGSTGNWLTRIKGKIRS
jgi:hypothetical protein